MNDMYSPALCHEYCFYPFYNGVIKTKPTKDLMVVLNP